MENLRFRPGRRDKAPPSGGSPIPNLIIGIDFGMTYTGVASYLNRPMAQTEILRDWIVRSNEVKVPTKMLRASREKNAQILKWGFECEGTDTEPLTQGNILCQNFKTYFNQTDLAGAVGQGIETPKSVIEAEWWITEYLTQIYNHVKAHFKSSGLDWERETIEFVFSVPTTWENPVIINRFETVVHNAGFGSDGKFDIDRKLGNKHLTTITLTEAEAAAVYLYGDGTLPLDVGDTILVCDAGGSTTDLGLFEVGMRESQTKSKGTLAMDNIAISGKYLKGLHPVQGIDIGSTRIDELFRQLVWKRLTKDKFLPGIKLAEQGVATKLVNSEHFERLKHGFGVPLNDLDVHELLLHGVDLDVTYEELQIERGKMKFSRQEINSLFDPIVIKICKLIDEQLEWQHELDHQKRVKCLVLSGGLSNSKYIQNCLKKKYEGGGNTSISAAQNMKIIIPSDPQMVVVKGLVFDRREKLKLGRSVISERVARASYGVLCNKLYDKRMHIQDGEVIEVDRFDRKLKFVRDRISWIIKKGDPIIESQDKTQSFYNNVGRDSPLKWTNTIVICTEKKDNLPESMKQGTAYKLCDITSDLTDASKADFITRRNIVMWNKYILHYQVNFDIKMVIGPAGNLKFELWFNGKPYGNSEDLKVEWEKAGVTIAPSLSNPTQEILERPNSNPPENNYSESNHQQPFQRGSPPS